MLRVLFWVCLGALAGCSPKHLATGPLTRKGYDGPILPPERTAIVEAAYMDGVSGEVGVSRLTPAWVIQPESSRNSYQVFFPKEGAACPELEEAKAKATGLKWDSLAVLGCWFEILRSNGQEYTPPLIASPERPAQLQVLPGEVEVDARQYGAVECGANIRGQWRTQPLHVRFLAEPGHTYRIMGKALVTPAKWRLWVEDTATGRTAAVFGENLATETNIGK